MPGEKSEIPKSNAFWVLESVILFYYPKNYYVTGFLACSRLGVDKKKNFNLKKKLLGPKVDRTLDSRTLDSRDEAGLAPELSMG